VASKVVISWRRQQRGDEGDAVGNSRDRQPAERQGHPPRAGDAGGQAQARSDVASFTRSLDGLTDEEVASLGPVLADAQSAAATVLAFSVLPKLSETQAKTLRQALATAKLEELRWLSAK
jgi:hypothetical protein